jgi:hypothetical protein
MMRVNQCSVEGIAAMEQERNAYSGTEPSGTERGPADRARLRRGTGQIRAARDGLAAA